MSHSARFGLDEGDRGIVLTFDNLGEASALERGEWPSDRPLGSHESVTEALPRLLEDLDRLGLRATFFIEAINCELYPEMLDGIAARGHELGVHGWRHEPWGELDAQRESTLLRRATEAFASTGIETRGFRPPGGELTTRTAELLRELGYEWCSPDTPTGLAPHADAGLAFVDFDWELVDAYHLMERFGELRSGRGGSRLDPEATAERLTGLLADGAGVQTVVMHPFLMLDPDWLAGSRRVLELLASLSARGQAWVRPGGEVASWLLASEY
ncbi:MAG: polysaccharide deacetylase family protein [Solirubrobacteraceae bacterium]